MQDYLIVGGGILGSTLAYKMLERGLSVKIIDRPSSNISSSVAAGIVNPVTGKRFVLSWMAEELFSALHEFYPRMETRFNTSFFYPYDTLKLFETTFDQNEWLKKNKQESYQKYIGQEVVFSEKLINPLGALKIKGSGRLDIGNYLTVLHQYFEQMECIRYNWFDHGKLKVTNDTIYYDDIRAGALIYADGAQASDNPFFNNLPYNMVHGELLKVKIHDFYTDRIINKGIFIVPVSGEEYLVGSTYNWDLKEAVTTGEGREKLTGKLKEVVKCDFEVCGHYAGIRPSTKDRRPFMGRHSEHKNVISFGGTGSKGVSMAPFMSDLLINYLHNKGELPPEADICRVKNNVNLKDK